MSTPQDLDPPRFFQLDSEFHAHLMAVLADETPGEVCMIDASGALLRLGESATCEALGARLRARRGVLRLVTFESETILASCPRFLQLRTVFGAAAIDWRVAQPDAARHIQQTSVLGPTLLARKPVRTAAHGVVSRDPLDLASQRDYFEEVWGECESAPPNTPLGL